MNEQRVNFRPHQGENFSFTYSVTSYPESDIKWWRSKNNRTYELITKSENPPAKETITKTSFEIKNLKYPDDDFFYKCNASNDYGNDSKLFHLEVYGKYTV